MLCAIDLLPVIYHHLPDKKSDRAQEEQERVKKDMEALFTRALNIAVGFDSGITVTILFFNKGWYRPLRAWPLVDFDTAMIIMIDELVVVVYI